MGDEDTSPSLSDLLSLGVASALIIAVCLGAGWGLDAAFSTSPILLLSGLGLGIVLAAGYLIFQMRGALKEVSEMPAPSPPPGGWDDEDD